MHKLLSHILLYSFLFLGTLSICNASDEGEDYPLPVMATRLAAEAQAIASGNASIQSIIDYQQALLSYGTISPAEAQAFRQNRSQCVSVLADPGLCSRLVASFKPDGE